MSQRSIEALSGEPAGSDLSKASAPAVVRAVRILDVLAAAPQPVSLADLARETGYPKSTLHGLCDTLARLQLLRRHASGAMTLGTYVMRWAHAFLAQTNITEAFYEVRQESAAFAEETVTLSVLEGSDIIYLACCNGSRPLGVTFRIGMRLSAAYTATGKAMLSTLPDEEVRARFGAHWPAPPTRAGVRDLSALQSELRAAREHGYSVDNGQTRDGMICFGAPVFDASGPRAVAGVAVSFLTAEIDAETGRSIGAHISALAKALSRRLGASTEALAAHAGRRD